MSTDLPEISAAKTQLPSARRKGDLYTLMLSVLEGLFPVFTLITVAALGALHAYFYTILFATLILAVLLWRKGKVTELLRADARRDLLLTSLGITTLFVLIFLALRLTTAGNVAVILVLQLFFSYLYFNVIGGEALSASHTAGAVLMGLGAMIILFPDNFHLNRGDALALAAAAMAPMANYYQQRARRKVSSITVLTFRNLVALSVLGLLAVLLEPSVNLFADKLVLFWLLCNAVLVFVVSKILWVEALNYISITRLSAMASFIPVFTMLFAWFLLGEVPQPRQLAGAVPVIAGAWLMSRP